MRLQQSWIALLALALASACSSIGPEPKLIREDADLVAELTSRAKVRGVRVAIQPIIQDYEGRKILNLQDAPAPVEDGEGAVYVRPSLSSDERIDVLRDVQEALNFSFADPIQRLPEPEEADERTLKDRVSELCQSAEKQRAEVLVTVEVLENQLVYLGANGSYAADLILLLMFPPFHIWIGDEDFELRRRMRVSFYDVRRPDRPLFAPIEVEESYRGELDEIDHGYIFLNPIVDWWSGAERFQSVHWQNVYPLLASRASDGLRRKLVKKFEGLEIAIAPEDFERSPRLHALVIGKNGPGRERAESDAASLYQVLGRRSEVVGEYLTLLTGERASPKAALAAVAALRTRPGDRILIYLSGRIAQGQLELADGKLPLVNLAAALKALRAELVFIVVDAACGADSGLRVLGSKGRALWSLEPAPGAPVEAGESGLLTRSLLDHLESEPTGGLLFRALERGVRRNLKRRSLQALSYEVDLQARLGLQLPPNYEVIPTENRVIR